MQLRRSQIFKQNLQITFTYKDSHQNQFSKKSIIFQSLIFPSNHTSRQPLAQAVNITKQNNQIKKNKILAQSMLQQNCFQMINQSHCLLQKSVGQSQQTGIRLFNKLKPKIIDEQIIQTRIQDFQIGELLGKGATGNVYVCRHKQTGFFFALKKIKKKAIVDKNQFIQSIKIHLSLNQPNIVKLYTVFPDSQYICLLMQLCMDGDLKTQIKNIKSIKQIKNYILGIAYGLRHLHRRGIRHGDVKLQNIMCSYGMPKIVDFDCISLERNKHNNNLSRNPQRQLIGSPLYFSPQMMRQSVLRLNDDVWSLGIIFYQLTCGIYPFQLNRFSNISRIIHQQIKQFPSNVNKTYQNLIRKMLSKRICERPTLTSIIKQLEKD